MRVVVDVDLCESNGRCVAEAPAVFRLDEDDDLHVLVDEPGEDRRAAVEAAARACPRFAITVEG